MTSTELVPMGEHGLMVNERDRERSLLLMDSHDLDQAMAELRGEVLASFVYVPKGAKPQLTYAGIKEAARLYRNVHFGATAVPLPDGTWMITSYAHNLADNTRVDYPMPYPAFDPANQEQAIKFRANLSKSLRNALAAVLPVAYLQTMIERWMEQRVGTTGPRAAGLPARPNPLEGESVPAAARSGQAGGSPSRAPTPTRGATSSLPQAQAQATVSAAAPPSPGSPVAAPVRPQDSDSEPPEGAMVPSAAQGVRLASPNTDVPASVPQDIPGLIRCIEAEAGVQLQGIFTLRDWRDLARTYGAPTPADNKDLTREWMIDLLGHIHAGNGTQAKQGQPQQQVAS